MMAIVKCSTELPGRMGVKVVCLRRQSTSRSRFDHIIAARHGIPDAFRTSQIL